MDPVSDEQTCSPTDGCPSLKLSKRRSSFEPTASVALTNERTASPTKPCFLTFGKPQKPSARACVKRSAFRAVLLTSCCPVHMLRCKTRARLHVCMLLIRCKTCIGQMSPASERVGSPREKSMSALFWPLLSLLPHLYGGLMSTASRGGEGGRRT